MTDDVRPTLETARMDHNRARLLGWLRANDLDPNDIPIDAGIVLTTAPDGSRHITTTVILRDKGGNMLLNVRGDDVRTEETTVPLKVEWEDFTMPDTPDA